MQKTNKLRWAVGLALAIPLALAAQQKGSPILFTNPSFEGIPKCCEAPSGWYNCGKSEESPPDIQPGFFQVTKAPSHGETYLGLVVRDNDTWEAIGQRLPRPLEINECYEFSLDLCRAELYLSLSRTTGDEVNYATPAKIRIYGGMGYCDQREMLYETPLITTTRWLTYTFRLTPKKGTYPFLYIEAYYKTPTLFPYNGNILMDNATPIKQIDCNMKPMEPPGIASVDKPNQPPTTGPKKPDTPPITIVKPAPAPAISASNEKISREGLKKGSTIRLENVYFDADKYVIKPECVSALMVVYDFLVENPDVVLEVGGHTNNRPSPEFAETLSTSRAKSVADWLVNKGIPGERVQYKGYGKKYPVDTNTTPEGRKRNQRVEIKILSING
ncbi:MAG: OmpA family protein [Lewinellaceae bacterium]|nr:OmpA family protein [Lewinellaceae bacterium]